MKRLAATGLLGPSATWADTVVPPLTPAVTMAQGVFGLVLVLALIFLCAWLLRRYAGVSRVAPGRFRVVAAVSLGARERAVLLQAGGKQLVLGVAPGRVETLCILEGADLVPVETLEPEHLPPFAQRLAELVGKKS